MFASGRCKQKGTTNWSRSSKPREVWEASEAIWQTMPTAPTSIFIRHSSTPRCKNEAVPESSVLCMRVKTGDYQPKCIIIISLQDQSLSVVTRWRGSILTNFLWYLQVTILGRSITLSTFLRRLLSISTP